MGKNRDRLSIIAAILEVANSGATKTRIMFNANLSFSLLEKYLNLNVNAGFIRVEGSIYKLTELGQEYLKQYKLFEDRYIRAQKLLEALDNERERLSQSCEQSKSLSSVETVVKIGLNSVKKPTTSINKCPNW